MKDTSPESANHQELTLALEKSTQEWEQAMDCFEEAIYLIDLDNRLVKANTSFYRLTGLSPKQTVGRDITAIIHPEGEDFPCPVCLARQNRLDTQVIMEADHSHNPTKAPIEVIIKMIRSRRGELLGVLTIIRNLARNREIENELRRHRDHLEDLIQERTAQLKATHEQLLHAEKLSAIGRLSASIAHEFNNPLQGIMSVIGRVKRTAQLDKRNRELLKMALSECQRIKRLIRDLQSFYRPSSGKMQEVDLKAGIEGILLLCRKNLKNQGIKVVTSFDQEIPPITTIIDQLKQVLLNLINNAADACERAGTISITTERQGSDQVMIIIEDDGSGIRPEDLKQIFEPFFSTKSAVKGTGLGLPVSYGIINRLGGKIEVESVENQGSTFTITLPIKGTAK